MMKKGNVFIITGLLLISAALFLTAYNQWDNYRAGKKSNDALKQLATQIKDDPVPAHGRSTIEPPKSDESDGYSNEIEYPDYILNPEMDMPIERIDGNDYIGVLSIPSIDRKLPVMDVWDNAKLKISPCRYSGSAYLGNMVVCAHNYVIHFGALENLKYGDKITFTDTDGNIFNYKVAEIEILQPTAVEEMKTGDWDLTLFTCTISGTARITVRCEKTEP